MDKQIIIYVDKEHLEEQWKLRCKKYKNNIKKKELTGNSYINKALTDNLCIAKESTSNLYVNKVFKNYLYMNKFLINNINNFDIDNNGDDIYPDKGYDDPYFKLSLKDKLNSLQEKFDLNNLVYNFLIEKLSFIYKVGDYSFFDYINNFYKNEIYHRKLLIMLEEILFLLNSKVNRMLFLIDYFGGHVLIPQLKKLFITYGLSQKFVYFIDNIGHYNSRRKEYNTEILLLSIKNKITEYNLDNSESDEIKDINEYNMITDLLDTIDPVIKMNSKVAFLLLIPYMNLNLLIHIFHGNSNTDNISELIKKIKETKNIMNSILENPNELFEIIKNNKEYNKELIFIRLAKYFSDNEKFAPDYLMIYYNYCGFSIDDQIMNFTEFVLKSIDYCDIFDINYYDLNDVKYILDPNSNIRINHTSGIHTFQLKNKEDKNIYKGYSAGTKIINMDDLKLFFENQYNLSSFSKSKITDIIFNCVSNSLKYIAIFESYITDDIKTLIFIKYKNATGLYSDKKYFEMAQILSFNSTQLIFILKKILEKKNALDIYYNLYQNDKLEFAKVFCESYNNSKCDITNIKTAIDKFFNYDFFKTYIDNFEHHNLLENILDIMNIYCCDITFYGILVTLKSKDMVINLFIKKLKKKYKNNEYKGPVGIPAPSGSRFFSSTRRYLSNDNYNYHRYPSFFIRSNFFERSPHTYLDRHSLCGNEITQVLGRVNRSGKIKFKKNVDIHILFNSFLKKFNIE